MSQSHSHFLKWESAKIHVQTLRLFFELQSQINQKSLFPYLPGPLASLSGLCFAWSITRCCASLQQRTAVVFLSFELDGPRKHSLNTVFLCFWRECALLLLPCSGTSIKGELCAGSRCGWRNAFKHCLWKSVIPLKSLRKAGKLICVRGALILWGRGDFMLGECQLALLMAVKLKES